MWPLLRPPLAVPRPILERLTISLSDYESRGAPWCGLLADFDQLSLFSRREGTAPDSDLGCVVVKDTVELQDVLTPAREEASVMAFRTGRKRFLLATPTSSWSRPMDALPSRTRGQRPRGPDQDRHSGKVINNDITALGGAMPTNQSAGLIGVGHPLGAVGVGCHWTVICRSRATRARPSISRHLTGSPPVVAIG
jgi:hypothetical protein